MIHSIKLVEARFVYAATVAQQLHVPPIFFSKKKVFFFKANGHLSIAYVNNYNVNRIMRGTRTKTD